MDKRKLVLKEYGISDKRYKELCGFCEQYPEWKAELKYNKDTMKSRTITDMPISFNGNSDQTGNLAVKRVELQKKCELIENTAKQASSDLWEYILDSVCYEHPLNYLQTMKGMPCSRTTFYDVRRYFFFLLDKNKEM